MSTRSFSVLLRAGEIAQATSQPVDVLVIGLGATGAGVALDAASRGMTVCAVDMGDVASGTSSKSSKLIHGGLRYLENYEFGLVHEGVTERQLLMRLAPHLVRPMDFVYPVWPDTARRRLLGLGLTTYDVFAGMRNVRRHKRITAEEAVVLAPALERAGHAYAYVYGDSATDDARLVLAVTRAARRFGALTLTYAEVTDMLVDADGHVSGVRISDRLTGESFVIHARHIVNATGVWADRLMGMVDATSVPAVHPSKGVHVVVPRARLPLDDASVLLPSRQGDQRSMFAIAWGRQTILGTTDTPYDGPLDELALTQDDVDYVLAATNAVFDRNLSEDDAVGAWAGVRPLLKSDSGRTYDMSRRHTIVDGPGALLTITGGKLTTYRRMARDVVDRIVARDDRRAPCRTDRIPLGCARPLQDVIADTQRVAESLALTAADAGLLVRQYGEAAADVLSIVASDPAMAGPLAADAPHLFAEVVYAARHEGAATLEDIFARRMRLSLRVRNAALDVAPRAAALLARELDCDAAWSAGQVRTYADTVRRERGVLGLPGLLQTA